MLDYTRAAGKRILRDIKVFTMLVNVATQALYIFYLIYSLFTGAGIFFVNLALLVLAVAYFGFYSYNVWTREGKTLSRKVKLAFKWCKRLIKLFNLGVMLYAVTTAQEATLFSLLLTALLIVFWVLDLIVEILCHVIRSWWTLLLEGLEADWQATTKPLRSVKNFFKKAAGQEVEEAPEPTKSRQMLDEMVEEERTKKQNERLESRFLSWQKKIADKLRRKDEKKAKKAEKKKPLDDEAAISKDE